MLGTIPNLALMTGLVALVRRVDRDRAIVAFGADRIIDANAASVDAVMCKEPRTEDTEDGAVAKYAKKRKGCHARECTQGRVDVCLEWEGRR
ncbi:hypothetical protein PC120_g21471 [Phytophthora cactorum]|nr:hypothetical protein PC120_g21471 [Phytophthora cactorum]